MTKKVYIGIGHGGSDAGAVSHGLKEKDLTLATGLACYNTLKRHGVDAKISRTTDRDSTIASKVRECNAFAGELDYCLDIHYNAGGGDGCEVYYFHGSEYARSFAEDIISGIKTIGQNSRGVKTKTYTENGRTYDYFGMIRDTVPIAVLVECAFLDTADIQIADTGAKQEAMGVAIAKGVLKHLGIAYREETAPTPAPAPKPEPERKTKYKLGQKVTFSTCYRSSSDTTDRAISAADMARNCGVITRILPEARQPYLLDNGLCWVNDGDIRSADGMSADTPAGPTGIREGDRVRVRRGARSYEGASIAPYVYDGTYSVDELRGERAVLDKGGICTAFRLVDLERA